MAEQGGDVNASDVAFRGRTDFAYPSVEQGLAILAVLVLSHSSTVIHFGIDDSGYVDKYSFCAVFAPLLL